MIFQLFLILNLLAISCSDFKERKVFIINLIFSFVTINYIHYTNTFIFKIYIYAISINISILVIILGILFLYSKLKLKKKLLDALGLGDVFFFFILATGFPTVSFLVILTLSLVFSLLFFIALQTIFTNKMVPLAGLQALFLTVLLVVNFIFKIVDLYAM